MTADSTLSKVVRVNIELDPAGLFYATSPDLKGLLVAESSAPALESAIPKAIADLYLAIGISVIVLPAEDMDGEHPMRTWIGVPSSVAHRLECALA